MSTISANPETSEINPLSKGSAFALLTTILLAILFHPFQGSLVYGPSLCFWLAASTAISAEICIVSKIILKHYIRHGSQYLRHKLFCVVAARLANAHGGDRRRLIRWDAIEAEEQLKNWVKEVHKGWRYRLVIAFPIIAQYVKLMITSGPGTIILKILGTLYVTHWIILELLLAAAKEGDERETVKRIRDLLPMHKSTDGYDSDVTIAAIDTGESFLLHEPTLFKIHQTIFILASWAMIMCWPDHSIPTLISAIVPWVWLLKISLQLNWRAQRLTALPVRTIQWKDAMVLLPFGGTSVGSDIGCIFILCWVLYCVFIYDGEGTSRAQWPWLDWFG